MRKSELLAHHQSFVDNETQVGERVQVRDFYGAIFVASRSLDHITPYLKVRRQSGESDDCPLFPFEIICRFAPPLFDHASIELLRSFTHATRQLGKRRQSLIAMLEQASHEMDVNRLLWNLIERHPGVPLNRTKFNSSASAMAAVSFWESLGIVSVEKATGAVGFVTSLSGLTEGMCPSCGARGKAAKEAFFRAVTCPKCKAVDFLHLCSN